MPDGRVEYEVRADTSHLVQDLNNADNLVRNAAQRTGRIIDDMSGRAGEAADDMSEAVQDAADSIEELGEAADGASEHVDDLGNAAQRSSKKAGDLKDRISDVKTAVSDAGKTIGKYASAAAAAVTAVGTAAVKSAADAESAFAKVKTLLSSGTDFDAYYNDIKAASVNTGVDFGSLSESVYGAISASVAQESAVPFTETAVKLAKGGFTQAATAVDVLTTAINAYGLAADDASHISDVLITTQNLGKTTVDELARNMGQTIPIANSANVAIEELSTQYAVMTKNGVATAEAGTQIKAMLNELNSAGSNVDKTLREVTGKSFSQLKDNGKTTADVLNMLSDCADSTGRKLSDLFGSVEAGAAALTLVKDGGKDFGNILNQMSQSAGAAETAYDTMTNTVEAKIEKLVNKIKVMFIDAGEELLPEIDKLIDCADDNADEIGEIITGIGKTVRDLIVGISEVIKTLWENKEAVVSVVAAYVAFRTAMAVGNVISSVVSAVRTLTTALNAGTTAQEALNLAMNLNPYVLAASAVAAVTVGLEAFVSQAETAEETTKRLSDEMRELSENAKAAAEERQAAAEEQKAVSEIVAECERLNDTVEETTEKKEKLAELQERLNGLYDTEKNGIDLVNGSLSEQIELLKKLSEEEWAKKYADTEEKLSELRADIEKTERTELPITLTFDKEKGKEFVEGVLNDIYPRERNGWNECLLKHFIKSFIEAAYKGVNTSTLLV